MTGLRSGCVLTPIVPLAIRLDGNINAPDRHPASRIERAASYTTEPDRLEDAKCRGAARPTNVRRQ
jgi:hypothetical protein